MTNCKPNNQKPQTGLYQSEYEHDACGVGMVVNIHGGKSHELVDNALKVLENMEHRGAETRDKTGDGAGIMVQIPHEFILLQGIPVPEKGKYGTGLVFLPKDEKAQQEILSVMIEEIEREGLTLMHLRTVPTNPEVLGVAAREVEPDIKQIFVTGVSEEKVPVFERILYKVRKRIENRIKDKDFYICSLSNKNIIYKGMLTSGQLRRYSLICRMITLQADWRWYTPVSAQTHFLRGRWPSPSVCWLTTVRSTPSVVIVAG